MGMSDFYSEEDVFNTFQGPGGQTKKVSAFGMGRAERPPATFGEVFEASYEMNVGNFSTDSKATLLNRGRQKRAAKYKELMGRDISEGIASGIPDLDPILKMTPVELDQLAPTVKASRTIVEPFVKQLEAANPGKFKDAKTIDDLKERLIDHHIESLRGQDAEKYKDLMTSGEIQKFAEKEALASSQKYQEISEDTSTFNRVAGGIGGGLKAQMKDPINIVGMLVGAGEARTLGRAILAEASVNAAFEAGAQPFIAQWQKEIGNEYTFADGAQSVGMAAMLGGAFPLARLAGSKSMSYVWSKIAENERLGNLGRSVADTLSRVFHLSENNPLKRLGDPLADEKHYESLIAATSALVRGEPLKLDDLKLLQAEFDRIDTTVREGMSEAEIQMIDRIKEFQTDVAERIKSDKNAQAALKEMPSAKEVTRSEKKLQVSDEVQGAPKNVDSAGVKFIGYQEFGDNDFRPLFNVEALDNTTVTGKKLADLGYKAPEIPSVDEWLKSKAPAQVLEGEFKAPKERTTLDEILHDEAPKEPKIQDEILEASQKPETIAAEEANFKRLLEENPDMEIQFEGRSIKVSDLMDEFAEDAELQRQISFCATGGKKQ